MEDSRRNTGRTTRMLLKAALALGESRLIIITAHNQGCALALRRKLFDVFVVLRLYPNAIKDGMDVLNTRYIFRTHEWLEDDHNTRGLEYIVFQDHYRP